MAKGTYDSAQDYSPWEHKYRYWP